ncbi:hypothetical protein FRB94_002898 [Tulasnella sp. JGI-2019a]|nr:hypothetical protein FRB93_013918 [Tulasnella sp. JGI-2019a]KAG9013370.1 hypothetical protein FRB94_002898 [Tulasnella sp. JGI-2019a]
MANLPTNFFCTARKASFIPPPPPVKSTKSKKTKKQQVAGWPHPLTFRATPTTLAEAGFSYPHQVATKVGEYNDEAVCFMCEHSLSGWEADDDPYVEHAKRAEQLKCPWGMAVCSIQADRVGPDSKQWAFKTADRLPTSKLLEKARLGTFGTYWPHDKKLPRGQVNPISSKKLAEAGFVFTPTEEALDMAACPYCQLAFDDWSVEDDPLELHQKRRASCPVFSARLEGTEEDAIDDLGVGSAPRASTRTPRYRKPSASAGNLADRGTSGKTRSADLSVSTVARKPSVRKASGRKPPAVEEDPEPEPEASEQEVEAVKPKKASTRKTPASSARSSSKQRKTNMQDTATETEADFDDAPETSNRQQSKRLSRHPGQKPIPSSAASASGHGKSRSQSRLAPPDAETGQALRRSASASRATMRSAKIVDEASGEEEGEEEELPRAAMKVIRKKKEKVLRPPSPEPEEYLVEVKQDEPEPPAVKPKAPRKSRKPKKSVKPPTPEPEPAPESEYESAVEVVEEIAPVIEVVKKGKGKGGSDDRRTITRTNKHVRDEELEQEQIPQPPPKQSKGKTKVEPLTDRNVDTTADETMSFTEEPTPLEQKPKKTTKAKTKTTSKSKAAAHRKHEPATTAVDARRTAVPPSDGDITTETEVSVDSRTEDVSEAESAPTSDSAMDAEPVGRSRSSVANAVEDEEDERPDLPAINHLHINGSVGPAVPTTKVKVRVEEREPPSVPSPIPLDVESSTPRNKPTQPPREPMQTTSQNGTRTPTKQSLHALPPVLAAVNPESIFSFTAEEREMTLEMFVERKMQEAQAQFEADGEREITEFLARAAEVRKRLEVL